jgi:NADH-quinone oxidoreductase subunit J
VTLFVVFGALALGAALAMVFQRNSIYAALLLVLNLLAVAVLYLSLGAEFLFASQIIVYAGAIVILFLFVIMLLGVDRSELVIERATFQRRQMLLGGLSALVLIGAVAPVLASKTLSAKLPSVPKTFGSAQTIGGVLFQTYLLPFELTGLLLLVATIGILMLAKRKPR